MLYLNENLFNAFRLKGNNGFQILKMSYFILVYSQKNKNYIYLFILSKLG